MPRSEPKPLDDTGMRALALAYVGRYATTQAGLVRYLARKLRERGWAGEEAPDLEGLALHFTTLGYVDDRAFAEARTRSLKRKGLGEARIRQALGTSGIERDLAHAIAEVEPDEAFGLALRLALRRRIGPFATKMPSEKDRQRWLGIMLRAGHDHALVRSVLSLDPEEAQNKLNA